MASTTSRGNYYKKKTQVYFEKKGYETQITEFMCGRILPGGKCIYVKRDVFSSDGVSMNGKEIIFWNSKHVTNTASSTYSSIKSRGIKEFKSHNWPESVKRILVIWYLRVKEPEIVVIS